MVVAMYVPPPANANANAETIATNLVPEEVSKGFEVTQQKLPA